MTRQRRGRFRHLARAALGSLGSPVTLLLFATYLASQAPSQEPHLELERVLRLPEGTLRSCAFSGDGRHLATLSDESRQVIFWNLETGTHRAPPTDPENRIGHVLGFRQGREILTVGSKRTELWDPSFGILVRRLETVGGYKGALAHLRPDGRYLILRKKRFDLHASTEAPAEVEAKQHRVWTPDGEVCVSSWPGTFIDVRDRAGARLSTIPWARLHSSLSISPDGEIVVVAGGASIEFLELPTLESVRSINAGAHGWKFLDPQYAVSTDRDGLHLWDLDSHIPIQHFSTKRFAPRHTYVGRLEISYDRRRIAVTTQEGIHIFTVWR